jgi:hypothetical protein
MISWCWGRKGLALWISWRAIPACELPAVLLKSGDYTSAQLSLCQCCFCPCSHAGANSLINTNLCPPSSRTQSIAISNRSWFRFLSV